MHRARRMRFGDIERGEIAPIILNLRPLRNRKAHISENFGQLIHHLANGMDAACRRMRRGQTHIKPLTRQPLIKRGGLQHRFARS